MITWRMFALKPAQKSHLILPAAILSVASRFFPLPESVYSRFPVGTRSRRISPRFRPIKSDSKTAIAHFPAKPIGICTYTNRATNAFRISTCRISRLKTVQNQHLRKNSRGRGYLGSTIISEGLSGGLSALPGAPSFAFYAKGGIRFRRRLGKHETNSIRQRRYQIQSCRLPHVFILATLAECALTQKGGGGPYGARKSLPTG
jgi:hypothetical protein